MNRLSSSWLIIVCAAAVLMVTMGARQSMGLFVQPMQYGTGLTITAISFALAVAQLMWGVAQPIAGAVADRYGARPVLLAGIVVLAIGCLMTPWLQSGWGLVFTLGILSAVGSGAGSFSVLMGVAANKLPPQSRGMASGVINAGGSFGQFVFAPVLQRLITAFGWMGAMYSLALMCLAALPFALRLTRRETAAAPSTASASPVAEQSLKQAVKQAFADRSYWLLHLGFFTCGFHIAFLVTHLPGEVALCGLPQSVAAWSLAIIGIANVAGSLFIGAMVSRYRSKYLLFWMYGSRALLIAVYLMLPRTDLTFYLFAAGLGFTWLATVPPTAAIVGKLFGVRYLATLFGFTLLSHQIGGFLGAYLGGVTISRFGDFGWMWYADMALAVLAALINLPIREPRIETRQAA